MFAFVHQKGKSHEHSTFLQILDNQEHVIKFLAQGFINKFTKQKAWGGGVPFFLKALTLYYMQIFFSEFSTFFLTSSMFWAQYVCYVVYFCLLLLR